MRNHSLSEYTRLLSSISSPFIAFTIDDTDSVVIRVLQTVLEGTDVQRAYIFLFSSTGTHLELRFEVCSDGVVPHKGILESVPVAGLTDFVAELKKGNDIFQTISRVTKTEEGEGVRAIMERLSIESFINIPMFFGSDLVGYIGFDSVYQEADWPDEIRYIFRYAGDTIASALFRKEQHAQIERMYAQQKTMLDNLPYNAWLTDAAGRFVAVNRHFLSMLGKSASEVTGHDPSAVLPPSVAQQFQDNEAVARRTGRQQIQDVQLSKEPPVWHKAFRTPVIRDDGTVDGVAGVSIDITEAKQIEQHLSELNEAKDTLFSTIGHDMRSPLTSLKLLVEMLIDGESTFPAETRAELYQSLNRQLDDTLVTLDSLFQWAQIQRSGVTIRKVNTTVGSLLEDAYAAVRFRLRDKRIRLDSTTDGEHAVCVDPHMVTSAIRNILTNAIKFTPEGGVVTVDIANTGLAVAVTIRDSGVGIAPDVLPKLLQAHGGVTTAGTNDEKGSGLGLILTKSFIEQNGGTLRIESEPGSGTRVTVNLPSRSS